MTSLTSARRAAEEFARVVDGTQADVADRYADLTEYVDLLRAHEAPAPRAEFVADLRTRLMAAADTLLVPDEPTLAPVIPLTQPTRRRERRLATLAAAVVIVGGSAGVAAAAESSLPGDPLYPVKRGIESAQVSLNSSDAAKGHDLIGQAGTRLDEIDSLIGHGDSTDQITRTLATYQRTAADGADLLFVAYQRGGSADDLASLREALSRQSAQLADLAGQAPPTAQPDFAAATALLAGLDQQARVLCSCGPDAGTDLTNLSSAPALQSLLTRPAEDAAAALLSSQNKALADKAGQLAQSIPKPELPAGTSTGTSTTRDGGTSSGTQLPSLPTQDPALKGTVTTVTSGVKGLLDSVSTSTGGILSPVTNTVDNTLDTVTNLLTGQ